MNLIRSLLFYGAFYTGSVLFVTGAVLAMPLGPRPFRAMVHGWCAWHRWCVTRLLGIRVVVEGRPAEGPALYAVRHESFFEAIDAPHLFDLPAVFAKRELFRVPLWGVAARHYGLVPVAREGGARMLRTMIAKAKEFSGEGRPLVIFPEGTRVPHGERQPLQSGFAGLYKLLGLPVVPVAVDSGPLYHRRIKRAGTITYRFSDILPPGLPRAEIEERVVEAMNALGPAAKEAHQGGAHQVSSAAPATPARRPPPPSDRGSRS